MLTKLKSILLWPFTVDNASFTEKGLKKGLISVIFIAALLFSLYKTAIYYYDIYYRAHVENVGWQDYVKNDEIAGTVGESLQIEAIQIKLELKSQ